MYANDLNAIFILLNFYTHSKINILSSLEDGIKFECGISKNKRFVFFFYAAL